MSSVKGIAVKAKAKRTSKSKKAYTRSELTRVSAFAGVALAGLGVSLPHLAGEVGTLTGASPLAAWFLAIVIDAGMIATKTHLSSDGSNRNAAWSTVIACTLLSMVLNAHAFASHAVGTFGIVMGIVFGLFLPMFIVSMSYLATGILTRHRS